MTAILGAALAVPYFYHRVDEEIRSRIENKIAAQYPHLNVRVRFAQMLQGEGIEVRGLSISERGAVGPQAELAYFDEVFFSCQTSLQELAKGEPHVSQVKVRRPVLRATRRPDGSWSVGKLIPLPKLGPCAPETAIENGTIEIFDPLKNPSSTLTLRDLHLTLKPVAQQHPEDVEPLAVEGYLAADQLQRVEFKGTVDRKTSRWSLSGTVDGLEISPELRAALPLEFADKLSSLGSLRCEGQVGFRLTHDAAQTPALQFEVDAQLRRGRTDDARLPFSLSDLRAHVRLDNQGIAIDNFEARNGTSIVRLKCQRRGYTDHSPAYLELHGQRIALDQNLVRVLPEAIRNEWHKHLPEGEVDLDLKLTYDGRRWTPEAEVRCLNVSFTSNKFPYRLERGTGTLVGKDNRLTVRLTAYSGGQPIRIHGDIINPGPRYTGSIEFDGDNIPFDEKLFVAMNDSVRPVVRALNPRGTFNFFARTWRDDPERPEVHQHLLLSLNRCSMNYDRFAYPLANIRGTLEMLDGAWTFSNLEGTNDTGIVKCQGKLTAGPGPKQLVLALTGENVPLEEELRDALPQNMGRLWNSLKPRGAVDLNVDLTFDSSTRKTDIKLQARPRAEISSIEPVYFPYRLEKFRGTIYYHDGHTELENVEAVHGRTLVSTGGTCDIDPDGAFHLRLKNLAVDRLKTDHELIGALPEGVRRIVAELKPTGALNVRGNVEFSKSGAANALLESAWDVVFDAHHASLEAGVKLENLYGSAKLTGSFDGKQFTSRGELALDAATYKNFQFTEITGPLWIDNNHVLLGAWADAQARKSSTQRVSAKMFGGTVLSDCQVTLGSAPQYTLRATLADADLAQFAKENVSGRQQLNGKVLAHVDLQGTGRTTHTLRGGGSIRLRDANIYELPVMVALLKILSVRSPDTTAFTKSDIDFRIQGEHVLLDRVNFTGDAISLLGQGQMNFDRQIDLTFHSVVGRDDRFHVPLVRNMLGEASQQFMQIRVEGTVDHPVTHSEAFPRVSRAIQQWQNEMQKSREPPPIPPPAEPQTSSLLRGLKR